MFKLSKKTEYALLALHYMSKQDAGTRSSASEISANYEIPSTLLAKIMQRLKAGGLVSSVKGAAGGYMLTRTFAETALFEVLDLFNEQVFLVECLDPEVESCECKRSERCDIRAPIEALNLAILNQVRGLTLAQFFAPAAPTVRFRSVANG